METAEAVDLERVSHDVDFRFRTPAVRPMRKAEGAHGVNETGEAARARAHEVGSVAADPSGVAIWFQNRVGLR